MYRPTGEHRPYDKTTGSLKNVVPFTDFFGLGRRGGFGGWGAVELAARLSYVNEINPTSLNGHYYNSATNTFTGGASGRAGNGQLTDTTLGVTWFLNAHTKLQFNWIHCMLDNVVHGYSLADLWVSRFQVDF
jgi:phosphate-selective porin OprO/OprP